VLSDDQVPRTADQAANLLAEQGKRVHIVSEGHARCLPDTCQTTAPGR
jgi:hypothetical protein